MQDDGSLKRTFENGVPEMVIFEYRTAVGEVRYKTFRADPSLEDVTARNYAPDDSTTLSPAPKEPIAGSSSSEGKLEYKNVLEYREINRHARRKIEAWLNDGWSVEWEWNGLDDEDEDSLDHNIGWRYNAKPLATHRMTLRRSKANLPPSASNKRIVLEFPTTPKAPWDSDSDCSSDSGSASDVDSDSE